MYLKSNLPMPQMFPMPTIVLMVAVCILCLLSITRVFWQSTSCLLNSPQTLESSAHKFTQTW